MGSYIRRIEFWIVLGGLLRLWGITDPPLEAGHHWRQITGLMVARNFLEQSPNPFFPRIDETNGATGIIGMEFPLLNLLHFFISYGFGYQHWYGRLINLIISSVGIYYFYKLVRDLFYEALAFFASMSLLVSTWFIFSRKMMPDTFCMSLLFIGLYFGYQHLQKHTAKNWLYFVIFISLGVLSKIPAVVGLSMVIVFWWKMRPRLEVLIAQAVAVLWAGLLVYLWYFVWCPYLSATYGNWYNAGMNLSEGLNELSQNLDKVATNFYFHSFNSFLFFILSLLGLLYAIYQREKTLLLTFSLYFAVFMLYAIKSGRYFHHHNYYIIPFTPMLSLMIGFLLSKIKPPRLKVFLFVIAATESIANQQHDFFIQPKEYSKLELESILDRFTKRHDLIAVNGNGDPQLIYFSHRKGWNASDEQIQNPQFLETIRKEGCKWLVIEKNDKVHSIEDVEKIFENERFIVYKL